MLSILILFLNIGQVWSGEIIYSSGPEQVALIELYSSEGCSSCPPADRWVSDLKKHPKVFKDFIPLNFHVDYWNYLGWTDRFSSKSFTQRQRRYASEWKSSRVYTPGFVLNGEEWRARNVSTLPKSRVGKLVVKKSGESFTAEFTSDKKIKGPVQLHSALLGHGLVTDVKYGENAGKKLSHEFVVLKTSQKKMNKNKSNYQVSVPRLKASSNKAKTYSVVFWVSAGNSQRPLQSAGGPLK